MRVSASIQLVWQMAGREAAAGQFEEITPEQFCLALLKFSELPVDEVGEIGLDANAARELASEVRALRRELEGRSVDSTTIRRALRRTLGSGGRPFEGGELHRSQASRDLFDATARRIDDAGGDTLEPIHLFCELMEQPTEVIAELFSSAIGKSGTDVRATPILDAFATDLTRQAEQQELEQITGRNAERQAILEVLARPDGGSIFLITDSDSAAQAVVHAVAHGVVARKQGRRMRIVDVTAKVPYGAGGSDTIEQLRMGLNEAGENPGVITVLPTIQAPPQPDNDPWADLVAMVMDRGAPQCICRFTCTSWESWVHLDPAWKKRGRAIWVQEQRPTEVPWEL